MGSYMDGMTESELAGLAASETAAKSHPDLPDGWVMKEVLHKRRDGSSHIDKYYYEPGTGKIFQSLQAAKKHVAASNEGNDLHKPLAKKSRLPRSLKKSFSTGWFCNCMFCRVFLYEEKRRAILVYWPAKDR